VSRALEARLGRLAERVAERLARRSGGGLGLPTGPIQSWPDAALRRFEHLVRAGGAVERDAFARLTDADLEWMAGSSPADRGADAAGAGAVGPERE
jgi:hypothetical protein